MVEASRTEVVDTTVREGNTQEGTIHEGARVEYQGKHNHNSQKKTHTCAGTQDMNISAGDNMIAQYDFVY